MSLDELTRVDLIFPEVPGLDSHTVLRALADRIAAKGLVDDPDTLYRGLCEREELGSTGVGSGVAIPHCKMEDLDEVVLAVGITRRAIDFGAVDGKPVRLFFVVVSPADRPASHLQTLAAISRWVKAGHHIEQIAHSSDPAEILDLLRTAPAHHS